MLKSFCRDNEKKIKPVRVIFYLPFLSYLGHIPCLQHLEVISQGTGR